VNGRTRGSISVTQKFEPHARFPPTSEAGSGPGGCWRATASMGVGILLGGTVASAAPSAVAGAGVAPFVVAGAAVSISDTGVSLGGVEARVEGVCGVTTIEG
jgi:hypothetical protein